MCHGKAVAIVLLGIVIGLAWLLSAHPGTWWIAPLQALARYEAFHIIAHLCIFASVSLLVYPRKRGWIYVVAGGVLIEIAQLLAAGNLLSASAFDLTVDLLGAAAGWLLRVYFFYYQSHVMS